MGDDDNNVMLFFQPSDKPVVKKIVKGVTVLTKYKYTKDVFIHKQIAPTEVPERLEKYIFDFTVERISNIMSIVDLNKRPIEHFLENNYERGGMIRLKSMIVNPLWRNEYKSELHIKKMQICKSCGNKALKGCCGEYSARNRVPLSMVIGWSEKS
jgi:hypothetical protein